MKTLSSAVFLFLAVVFASCGDMSNNTNEQHTNYTDSSGMNTENSGNPNAQGASMRNVYDTDSATNTSGPDNAAPKSSATDSAQSTSPRITR